jgi:4-hydroxybenzoate polyprenyltransferase
MKHIPHLKPIVRLSRYQEYISTVAIVTLLGVLVSGVHMDAGNLWRLFFVLLANILAVAFAFMVNDIEDAKDDALDEVKARRNPVSAGTLSYSFAVSISFFTAISSLLIFYYLGGIIFWCGLTTLILGIAYSWRQLRLKSYPLLDLLSHSLMLAGLQLACAYFAMVKHQEVGIPFIAAFTAVMVISMYGEIFNEIRDFKCDTEAGLNHTVVFIGIKNAYLLMNFLWIIAVIVLIMSIIVGIVPIWVIGILLILSALFLIPERRGKNKQSKKDRFQYMQKPVVTAGIIVLLLWLITNIASS